ncbi:hypothetical protein GN956_G25030, partial [Arapaima gigas]
SSLTLVKPSMRPVGLPCASCVWNTNFGRRSAGGGGSPAPLAAVFPGTTPPPPPPPPPPPTSSFSTKCELSLDLFFFFLNPSGISSLTQK